MSSVTHGGALENGGQVRNFVFRHRADSATIETVHIFSGRFTCCTICSDIDKLVSFLMGSLHKSFSLARGPSTH